MTCVCFCTPIRKAAYTIPLGLRLLEGFFLLGAITPHFFVSSILFVFMTVVILVVVVAFHVLPAPCHCYSCASKYAAFLHSSQVRILLLHSLSYEARESVIYLKLFLRNLFLRVQSEAQPNNKVKHHNAWKLLHKFFLMTLRLIALALV